MIISEWCIVAVIALIMGTIVSVFTKDGGWFAFAGIITLLIGFGCLISSL